MNTEQEKTWKKLAKKDLVIDPRVSSYAHRLSDGAQEMIADLQDKLDDTYTIRMVNSYKDPGDLRVYCAVELVRTDKHE